jgi:hypothetical protein
MCSLAHACFFFQKKMLGIAYLLAGADMIDRAYFKAWTTFMAVKLIH